jgi:hypothetical protein
MIDFVFLVNGGVLNRRGHAFVSDIDTSSCSRSTFIDVQPEQTDYWWRDRREGQSAWWAVPLARFNEDWAHSHDRAVVLFNRTSGTLFDLVSRSFFVLQ